MGGTLHQRTWERRSGIVITSTAEAVLLLDQAWYACTTLGGGSLLAVIENYAEYNWIMGMYSTYYSTWGGLYLDATRTRYGVSWLTAAWRGGTSLASTAGTRFNSLIQTSSYTSPCGGAAYKSAFYLNSAGNMVDVAECEVK